MGGGVLTVGHEFNALRGVLAGDSNPWGQPFYYSLRLLIVSASNSKATRLFTADIDQIGDLVHLLRLEGLVSVDRYDFWGWQLVLQLEWLFVSVSHLYCCLSIQDVYCDGEWWTHFKCISNIRFSSQCLPDYPIVGQGHWRLNATGEHSPRRSHSPTSLNKIVTVGAEIRIIGLYHKRSPSFIAQQRKLVILDDAL